MKKTNKLIALFTLLAMLISMLAACKVEPCEEHDDSDGDGICDVCDEELDGCSAHVDKNDNGKCDECMAEFTDGCDTKACVDSDGDKKCDNPGCDKEIASSPCQHVDADDNGKCDICKTEFSDGCNKHTDADDNGKCDNCNKTFSDGCDTQDCLDTDGDGKCDNPGCNKETANKPSASGSYTVTVTTAGGMKMSGINVYVFDGATLKTFGTTDADGVCVFENMEDKSYSITLSGVPAGYNVSQSGYAFENGRADIVLSSAVIPSGGPASTYSVGDVMYDFEVTDTTGKALRLSELLTTKKAVLINFWFATCGPCVNEFPYMLSAYEKYSEDIAIVALNSTDTLDEIKVFQSQMGLTFSCVRDMTALESYFGISGYPTSVIVDRYGVICLIETGGLTSERPFTAAFDHFTADEYEQTLFYSFDELTPAEKPIYQMPSGEEIENAVTDGTLDVEFTIYQKDGEPEEYAWPFVLATKDGKECIVSSNYHREGSYAQIFAYVTLKAGEAIAFDYFAITERGSDYLYVLVDGKDIYTISGTSSEWESCYPYVATEDGTYELAFIYLKDNDVSEGDDRIYIDNLRITDSSEIDRETYVPRYAATKLNENGLGYKEYVDIFFNESDGYYHVGKADGPILLANLMNTSRFNPENSIYNMAYDGEIYIDGEIGKEEYYNRILPYFTCASNSALTGYCSVNEELMQLLIIANRAVGDEPNNDKAWLKLCSYFDAYGTNGKQLEDPIKGLSTHSAYEAHLGNDNVVSYDRVIMPRGLWYRFTPTVSGVYRITSDSEQEVNSWIFLEDGTLFLEYWECEKGYHDINNVSMVAYLEAGVDYYIDIAYYDVYQVGSFTFEIKYEGEYLDYLILASPGFFTYYENEETGVSDLNDIISGGIDIVFNPTTGYYHHDLGKNEEGEQIYGSVLYVDFKGGTTIFSHTLEEMILLGAFDFSKSESDHEILAYLAKYKTVEATKAYLKTLWTDAYDEYAEIYQLDEVLAGIYHGDTVTGDKTAEISAFLDRLYTADDVEDGRLVGCVPVDESLAELLQLLMDKYTFAGVEYSWAKLAYYYEYLGEREANNEIEP